MSRTTPVFANPETAQPGGKPLEPDVIVPEEFEDEELYREARRGQSDATDKPCVVPQEDIEEAGSPISP